jgi:hypothetical protein
LHRLAFPDVAARKGNDASADLHGKFGKKAAPGQSSIEILFAVCHGRVSVALSHSKPSVVCSESSFLPKNCPKLQEHHNVFNERVPDL